MSFKQAVDWVKKNWLTWRITPTTGFILVSHHWSRSSLIRARLKQKYFDGPYGSACSVGTRACHVPCFSRVGSEPYSFETIESVCGDTLRIKERYLTPSKQAAAISLDFDQFSMTSLLGIILIGIDLPR